MQALFLIFPSTIIQLNRSLYKSNNLKYNYMAAQDSAFRDVIDFFVRLGVYDVILPFLLVFTIVFAIFEKTKVLGTDKDADGKNITKKNLNAMVAFCIAFFVILSKQLVGIINEAMANIVLLLLVSISFLLLIGSFYKEGEEPVYLEGPWKIAFMFAMLIGVVVIFLHAIKTDGKPWLNYIFDTLVNNWNTEWVAGIVFVIVIIGFMAWVVGGSNKSSKDKKKDKKD
ncbi:hypothetical protein COT47_02045 [Candidatus Woesearchaeota archaeon CG08_land_8_20_14_0_20_43_7]|nr:MAG: hypothetical protein COT47_02045 [Candidatus Woesearchaeota archaeon CG08_land_8_20_14_0_20_43_7]